MNRRDFFKFVPAAGGAAVASAVMGKDAPDGKVPLHLRCDPDPHGVISVQSVQGETVLVDMNLPLEKQFSGRMLERVRRELNIR